MKNGIIAAIIVGMMCITSGAVANTNKKVERAAVSQISQAGLKSFTGQVKMKGATVFLETDKGNFPLEGDALKKFVGKQATVLGTLKTEGDVACIVVARAMEIK